MNPKSSPMYNDDLFPTIITINLDGFAYITTLTNRDLVEGSLIMYVVHELTNDQEMLLYYVGIIRKIVGDEYLVNSEGVEVLVLKDNSRPLIHTIPVKDGYNDTDQQEYEIIMEIGKSPNDLALPNFLSRTSPFIVTYN